jgi:hypothetical protein
VWGKYLWSFYAMKVTKLWHSMSRVEGTFAVDDVSISHSSFPFNFFFFFGGTGTARESTI